VNEMSSRSTNPQLKKTVAELKRASRKNKVGIWETVASLLSKSKRSRISINVGQIERHVSKGDIVAIPGIVLGSGIIENKVTAAAYKFTNQAKAKIEKAGGQCLSLVELAEKHPKGSGIKILR
jgi:large subunit ribosomal protein L18e